MLRVTQKVEWNGWEYDPEIGCLRYDVVPKPAPRYLIQMERCRTSAEVLNWLVQVQKKEWAGDTCVAGLLAALDYLLNLQGSLCGSGKELGPINARLLAKKRSVSVPAEERELDALVRNF